MSVYKFQKMKIATCVAVVFASVVSAQAAPPVSVNSLNVIGLSNLSRMSDAQGNQVRAKYTYVAGGSLTRVSPQAVIAIPVYAIDNVRYDIRHARFSAVAGGASPGNVGGR